MSATPRVTSPTVAWTARHEQSGSPCHDGRREMIAPVLAAVIPVLVAIGIGFVWVRSGRLLQNAMLTPLVVDIGTLCLILATFLKINIAPASFATIALASVAALIAFAAVAYMVLRLLSLRVRTFLPSLTFPNNGNLGLPLAAYVFGNQGLGYAIVFYAICMIGQLTIGQAIAAGTANWRGILRLPFALCHHARCACVRDACRAAGVADQHHLADRRHDDSADASDVGGIPGAASGWIRPQGSTAVNDPDRVGRSYRIWRCLHAGTAWQRAIRIDHAMRDAGRSLQLPLCTKVE
jgi:Membrane transport protein